MKGLAPVAYLMALSVAVPVAATASAEACESPILYPGDVASNVAIAGWMAHGARAREVPGELPVMAALVESGLKNLTQGNGDAKGYFAMRESIWNMGPYAGFPEHPELQLTWFLDHAPQARAARVAAGDGDFGLDPSTWGEWIADVQRLPEPLRGRYQLRLRRSSSSGPIAPDSRRRGQATTPTRRFRERCSASPCPACCPTTLAPAR